MATIDAATHYENITDMWKEIMGDDFHFGYFETLDTDLPQATRMMVVKLLEPLDICEDTRVLDVGCGIGGPALFIHEHHHCTIDGISTSRKGVETANRLSKEKGYDRVRFKVADGLHNGFQNNTFDLVWIMEASHPIQDKKALFRECFRVLKRGGSLAMCDLAQAKAHPRTIFWRLLTLIGHYLAPPKVWGPAYMPTIGTLCDQLIETGFTRVNTIDISKQAAPTPKHWRENAVLFRDKETGESSRQYASDFIDGCTVLENAYRSGSMKYGMLFAHKES
jgi:cyclopropane fatty-acyl-phospholipid synthase-like methyltransferase